MKRRFLLWLLLFFVTTNDLTVVFSLGQSAETTAFLLRGPLSCLLIIVLLTPPLRTCFPHINRPGFMLWVIYFPLLTAGIRAFPGFLWLACACAASLHSWRGEEGHSVYAGPSTVYLRFKLASEGR